MAVAFRGQGQPGVVDQRDGVNRVLRGGGIWINTVEN